MASRAVMRTANVSITTVNNVLREPLITGALLWILTRGPADLRERLLRPFRNNLLATNTAQRQANIIKTLKVLVVYGAIKRIEKALNRLALNGWRLKSKGPAWNFNDAKNELVVITGGSSGFGYEMVKSFSDKARVVVIDVNELPKELAELPGVDFFKCDLSDLNAITSCASAIKNKHGNATVLVNNAGIANIRTTNILETQTESLERIFKVNLLSHFILIREFLPGMLEARKGHIVTIASTASFLGRPGLLDYSVTKAGAMALHEGLRAELLTKFGGDHRIRATIVHPSWHATGIVKPVEERLKTAGVRLDPPSNVANAVVQQVVNDKSGQLIIPASHEGGKRLRGAPVWFQDVVSGDATFVPARFRM